MVGNQTCEVQKLEKRINKQIGLVREKVKEFRKEINKKVRVTKTKERDKGE